MSEKTAPVGGWRADCFRTRMAEFDAAYAKARGSSQPQDWMEAALLAQQFRNVAYAVLTGEAPKQMHPLPFSMDPRAQAAVLADLPPSVAQEAGEFYQNADAGRPKGTILKREAMAVAWQGVLRPYLIGLRDHHAAQARPAAAEPWAHMQAKLPLPPGWEIYWTCLETKGSFETHLRQADAPHLRVTGTGRSELDAWNTAIAAAEYHGPGSRYAENAGGTQ